MLGSALLGLFYLASATAQTPEGDPPPIPVGRKAVTWARAGIARSNATRSNYVRPHITVLLTKFRYPSAAVTVDVTDWTRLHTLQVSQVINDEPDTCSLTFKPELPAAHIPQVGDLISVGLATEHLGAALRIAAGLEFAGPVIVKQYTRRVKNESPWVALQCQDWQWFFDAQIVNATWPKQSATLTILDLLTRFVNYSQVLAGPLPLLFTSDFVPAGLPECEAFTAVNWRPTQVLRHLTNAMKGGFYIDARRAVHAWANGPEPLQSDPMPLENYRLSLKAFRHTVDASQVRKRVVVEGMTTQTLTDTPPLWAGYVGGIPVAAADAFTGAGRLARVGAQWAAINVAHTLQVPTENPFTAHVAYVDVAITDHWLYVSAVPPFAPIGSINGWVKVGEQYLMYDVLTTSGTPAAAGAIHVNQSYFPFGKMIAPVKLGETVTWIDWINNFDVYTHSPVTPFGYMDALPAGTDVVLFAQAVDPDAAQPWAVQLPPIEALVQDGRYGYVGANARAVEDLNFFKMPALSAQWETDDFNARPGRSQFINLTDVDPVTALVTILRVDVGFPLRTLAPRRQCTGASVKPAKLLDVMITQNA